MPSVRGVGENPCRRNIAREKKDDVIRTDIGNDGAQWRSSHIECDQPFARAGESRADRRKCLLPAPDFNRAPPITPDAPMMIKRRNFMQPQSYRV